MKRKSLHLVACASELARFLALMFLAESFGAVDGQGGIPRLLRYAAAPQLLYAVGFFFLWLDRSRYEPYRPLLAIGKVASLATLVPLALELLYGFADPSIAVRDPAAALACAAAIFAVDAFGLGLLAALRPARGGEPAAVPSPPASGEAVESVEATVPPAVAGERDEA